MAHRAFRFALAGAEEQHRRASQERDKTVTEQRRFRGRWHTTALSVAQWVVSDSAIRGWRAAWVSTEIEASLATSGKLAECRNQNAESVMKKGE